MEKKFYYHHSFCLNEDEEKIVNNLKKEGIGIKKIFTIGLELLNKKVEKEKDKMIKKISEQNEK